LSPLSGHAYKHAYTPADITFFHALPGPANGAGAVTGLTLRPAVSPGARSSTTAYSCARLTLTACDIDDAREMVVAAVMDCSWYPGPVLA
jgi:hypothetical protein